MQTQVRNENETIAQFALRILSPIPDEKWLTQLYTNKVDSCCAIGHYQRLTSGNPMDFSSGNCHDLSWHLGIRGESIKYFKHIEFTHACNIATVNNGDCELYQQPTPKARTLALLEDMIKAGF